jgi:IclR family transcriptional regulator, KDG regulon repressor
MGRKSEIDILASFDSLQPQLAADIVERTGLPRSTVFRALRQLSDDGFVSQEPSTSRYVLGPRMLQLGLIAREQLNLNEFIAPPLLALASQVHETVTFSVVDLPWRLCAFVLEAPSDLRSVASAGTRYPLHSGAASTAILAHLPTDTAEEVLRFHGVPQRELAKRTARLAEIRETGSVVSVGQRVVGATSVAAPILTGDIVFGAIAIAGPSERLAPRLQEFESLVIKVGGELSDRLTQVRPPRQPDRRSQSHRRGLDGRAD